MCKTYMYTQLQSSPESGESSKCPYQPMICILCIDLDNFWKVVGKTTNNFQAKWIGSTKDRGSTI